MKIDTEWNCVICEQCGAKGPQGNTWQEMAKLAVTEAGWGYSWEHIDEFDHVAHFFCAKCKADFECITAEDIPT